MLLNFDFVHLQREQVLVHVHFTSRWNTSMAGGSNTQMGTIFLLPSMINGVFDKHHRSNYVSIIMSPLWTIPSQDVCSACSRWNRTQVSASLWLHCSNGGLFSTWRTSSSASPSQIQTPSIITRAHSFPRPAEFRGIWVFAAEFEPRNSSLFRGIWHFSFEQLFFHRKWPQSSSVTSLFMMIFVWWWWLNDEIDD